MFTYVLKRIGLAFLTFVAIVFIIYLLQASYGRNPLGVQGENAAQSKTGTVDNTELIAKYWLDRAPILRFFKWVGELFSGSLGPVYRNDLNIELPKTFFESFRWTILITIPAFILSTIFGIALGTLAAYKRAKLIDTSIVVSTSVIAAIPTFIIAPLSLIIAYKYLGLPIEFVVPDVERGIGWDKTILSLFAPIFIFTITGMSGYAVYTRNQMINILTSNQVLIAKSKGLSGFTLFRKHVLRNASIPLMAFIIPSYIGLLGGSIVLERFFGVPGSAQVLISAQRNGEINVVMFSVIFYSSLTLLTNILVDILYTVLDPQIKLTSSNSNKSYSKRLSALFVRTKIGKEK